MSQQSIAKVYQLHAAGESLKGKKSLEGVLKSELSTGLFLKSYPLLQMTALYKSCYQKTCCQNIFLCP